MALLGALGWTTTFSLLQPQVRGPRNLGILASYLFGLRDGTRTSDGGAANIAPAGAAPRVGCGGDPAAPSPGGEPVGSSFAGSFELRAVDAVALPAPGVDSLRTATGLEGRVWGDTAEVRTTSWTLVGAHVWRYVRAPAP